MVLLLKIILVTLVAILIGGFECAEWWHAHRAMRYPLMQGRVVLREPCQRMFGIRASGRLTIVSADGKVKVVAITSKAELRTIPDQVKFYYSGDPTEEVFLECEDNPGWLVLLFWGPLPLLWGLYLFHRRRHSPEVDLEIPLHGHYGT